MGPDVVLRAAEDLHVHARQLSGADAQALIDEVEARHAPSRDRRKALWERLRGSVSVRNPQGWRWLSSLPARDHVVLAARDERDAWWAVEFGDGADLVRVLAELQAFEFFAVADGRETVVCFNDHDHLIAAGRRAVEWLHGLGGQPED